MWLSISRFRFFARSLHLALARTRFFFRSHPRSLVIERMVCSVLAVSLLFLSLVLGGSSEHSLVKVKRARHGKHQKGLANSKSLVESRGTGSFTFYTPGLGACGGTNSENDFIVALSSQSWDGGSHCGEKVTISANGRRQLRPLLTSAWGANPDIST
ncbi:hypothetical protein DL96DRAFT_90831 [Flagelloscypha sp. PMI_526]|nr:hypothetical protein DL96DRAFT_90831 [Flagelloscypha sp. PMI_526]